MDVAASHRGLTVVSYHAHIYFFLPLYLFFRYVRVDKAVDVIVDKHVIFPVRPFTVQMTVLRSSVRVFNGQCRPFHRREADGVDVIAPHLRPVRFGYSVQCSITRLRVPSESALDRGGHGGKRGHGERHG